MTARPRSGGWIFAAAALIAAGAVVLLAACGVFVRPMADDWCHMVNVRDRGVLGTAGWYYASFGGRFTGNFALAVAAWGTPLLTLALPAILLVGWVAAAAWLVAEAAGATGTGFSRVERMLGACLWVVIGVAAAPYPFQSYYWSSAMVTYAVPPVLALVTAALIVRFARRGTSSVWRLAAVSLLALVTGGFSEPWTSMQLAVCVLAALGLVVARRGGAWRGVTGICTPWLLAYAAGTLAATIIMLAAPGNASRIALTAGRSPLGQAFLDALLDGPIYIWGTLQASALMAAGALALGAAGGCRFQAWEVPSWRRVALLSLGLAVGACLLSSATIFPGLYETSLPPPLRAMVTANLAILLALAGIGVVVGRKLSDLLAEPRRALASAVLGVLLTAPAAAVAATVAVTLPNMTAYAAARDGQDRAASGGGKVVVPAVTRTLDLYVLSHNPQEELGSDPTNWINVCEAEYYNDTSLSTG